MTALTAQPWNFQRTLLWKQTIFGQPVSKSNRRIITKKYRQGTLHPFIAKSKEAQQYESDFCVQVIRPLQIECNVIMICKIYYSSRRSDLDDSLICDCLQKAGVIKNDRQIIQKHLYQYIDKVNPRAEIELYSV